MPINLIDAIVEMQEQEALQITEKRIGGNGDPLKILDDCSAAMEIVGKRFESGEYFLPLLIMAVEILKQVSEILKSHMKGKANPESWAGSSSGLSGATSMTSARILSFSCSR